MLYRLSSFGSISIVLPCMMLPHLTAASSPCRNTTRTTCLNGGYCNADDKCECPTGYSGSACEQTATSTSILVVVCILPLITWSIVCFYGFKSCHNDKAARGRRRRPRARDHGEGPQSVDNDVSFDDDEPPGYYQVVHHNPVSICSHGVNPDWTGGSLEYPDLPPHYEDLALAFKTVLLPNAFQVDSRGTATGQQGKGTNTASVALTRAGATTLSPPVRVNFCRCHPASLSPEQRTTTSGDVTEGGEGESANISPSETLEQRTDEPTKCCFCEEDVAQTEIPPTSPSFCVNPSTSCFIATF